MTGVYDGKLRFTNNYRTQWTSLGKGYKTIHSSLDVPVGKSDVKNNYFGVGAMVYQDKAGDAGFTSTIIEGSLSCVTALDDIGDHYFSIGFRGGLNQTVLIFPKTTWDTQWNGDTYDPSLPSFESIQLQQFIPPRLQCWSDVFYMFLTEIIHLLLARVCRTWVVRCWVLVIRQDAHSEKFNIHRKRWSVGWTKKISPGFNQIPWSVCRVHEKKL